MFMFVFVSRVNTEEAADVADATEKEELFAELMPDIEMDMAAAANEANI